MSRHHISQKEIESFANERVNLPQDLSNKHRAQARRLREKLDDYMKEHPDFALRKMLLSGSLAKSTALRTINDIDIACYINSSRASADVGKLLIDLAEHLRQVFPNFNYDQVSTNTYSVTVSFRGSGLDVDVVPIIYRDDPAWYGDLVSQEDGTLLSTSIPLHLEFAKKRRDACAQHFSQVVRLAKFWAKKNKRENGNFRFKSFMIELILAKLSDNGVAFSNYIEALQQFFTYIAVSNLEEMISFTDYYSISEIGNFSDPIQIIDPVNPSNNAARLYTESDRQVIVNLALDAGDAIDAACAAPTKQETIRYWQKVFGSAFNA